MKFKSTLAFIFALAVAPIAQAQTTNISIAVPTALMPRVLDALAPDYQATITNADGTTAPNPLTRAQTARRRLIDLIKQEMAVRESAGASFTAAEKARTDADAIQ